MMGTMTADHLAEAGARMAELERLAVNAPSAEERAKAALEAYNYCRGTYAPMLAAQRRSAVRELRAIGYSLRECADMLGVTDSRIAQITGT